MITWFSQHLAVTALGMGTALIVPGFVVTEQMIDDVRAETETQDPEIQDPEHQDAETQDPEHQDAETQDAETQDPEHQDPEIQDPEIQDPEIQDPEIQDPEIQEAPIPGPRGPAGPICPTGYSLRQVRIPSVSNKAIFLICARG